MELGTVLLGAGVGGVIGLVKGRRGGALKYALWGGGVGFAVSLFRGRGLHDGGVMVGQLPQTYSEPGLPGRFVYNVDPRQDPLLDPVSKRQVLPDWYLAHWQHGDPKIVAEVQSMLGVPADGSVGSGTMAALTAFQRRSGLPVGDMNRMTMAALVGG